MNNPLAKFRKEAGIFGLLTAICAVTGFLEPEAFLSADNLQNTIRWTALFGVISIGVAFVIMTGGIDLSIGSVICLTGCILSICLATTYTEQDKSFVESVNRDAKVLTLREGTPPYEAGDVVQFRKKTYEVKSVSGNNLIVDAAPSESHSDGDIVRAHRVVAVGEVDKTVVRRGRQRMYSMTVSVPGDQTAIQPDDRLHLITDRTGEPRIYVVHSTSLANGQTTFRFLVRQTERIVGTPKAILLENRSQRMPIGSAIAIVLVISFVIGITHGLLITKVKLQPFVVTLCGLLFYRGLIRGITEDQTMGFGIEYPNLKSLAVGGFLEEMTGYEYVFDFPMVCIYLVILAVIAGIFLNKTIFGRYILAVGRNEEAALYSGINTDRVTILAYVICSMCAGLAGILFALDLNSLQPASTGNFYELYAIAGAVLGGCSLRGGEGSIIGVIIATGVMQVLRNAINLVKGVAMVNTSTEFAIIGLEILAGVITGEVVKRAAARRRAAAAKES